MLFRSMAELCGDGAFITAFDVSLPRLRQVTENVKRLGIRNVRTYGWDATLVNEAFLGKADKVLADVPCSGLGAIRKKPDIKWTKTGKIIDELVPLQKKILAAGSEYLKVGGRIIYATCTVNKEENEYIVRDFLAERDEFELIEQKQIMPSERQDGFYYAVIQKNE